MPKRLKIVHVIYQLSTGGLENGLVNLVNHLPEEQYEHIIISLTYSSKFKERIKNSNCRVIDLEKKPGSLFKYYPKLFKILKNVRPDVVHTRNLSSIEVQSLAWILGVPLRIHSEHGRDVNDLAGDNKKNQFIRKCLKPFIHQFVPLSKELEHYLQSKIHIPESKIQQIYNGVDLSKFSEVAIRKSDHTSKLVLCMVGRLQAVKSYDTVLYALSDILKQSPNAITLKIVGDGPLRTELEKLTHKLNIYDSVEFLGNRSDIPQILSSSHIFIQPSLIEGISNTILEAMSCGLPVIASQVGGNPELVVEKQTGLLFPAQDVPALKSALCQYIQHPDLIKTHGVKSRERVENLFSLNKMVENYQALYQQLSLERNSKCAA